MELGKTAPCSDQSFSGCISSLKNYFYRWLQLSNVKSYQSFYHLMIINKVYESYNAILVAFMQERDPVTLTELTKLGNQYYDSNTRV